MKSPVSIVLFCLLAATARADVIMEWNARADDYATAARLTPTDHARVLALLHVSMFEAVNAIERRYAPYRLKLVTDRNTSRDAAAAAAGHAVLAEMFPERSAASDEALSKFLDSIPPGMARERGLLLGQQADRDP